MIQLNIINESIPFDITANPGWIATPPFAVQFMNNTPNRLNYSFYWDFGDGSSTFSNDQYIYHQYMYNGFYDVKLISQNFQTGCYDTVIYSSMVYCSGGTGCNHSANIHQNGTIDICRSVGIIVL